MTRSATSEALEELRSSTLQGQRLFLATTVALAIFTGAGAGLATIATLASNPTPRIHVVECST